MASTATRPASGVTSAWRQLGRMQTYQVPIVLGGLLAALSGVVTYGLAIAKRVALVVPSTEPIFLVFLGTLGLIAYAVTKQNVRNGVIVAGLAGAGLIVLGGDMGLFTGLIVLAGAIWGFARNA